MNNTTLNQPNAITAPKAWYAVHSKPHKESQVDVYLNSHGIESFFPMIKVKPVNPRSSKIRPYFPGYLFAHVNLEEIGLNTLQWIPGAIGLVQFDGQAAVLPDPVIIQLKRRLDQIKAAGGLIFDGLNPGDRVRITDGPLAGCEGIFDLRLSGSQRVQILLEMLGRLVRAEIHVSALVKLNALPTEKR